MASDEDLVEIRIPPPPGGIEIPGIEGMCYPDSAGPMYPRREINWTSATGHFPRHDDFEAEETDPVVGGADGA